MSSLACVLIQAVPVVSAALRLGDGNAAFCRRQRFSPATDESPRGVCEVLFLIVRTL